GAIYEGLTVEFCKKVNAKFILRGIRYVSDFEYEKTIADANRTLDKSIETIFLTGEPKYTSVASTIVRDIIRNGGDASHFLPAIVVDHANFYCVGLEINANHIRGATEGFVTGVATPLHLGKTTHVWDIKIYDEKEKLICVSRLTVVILKRK